jgi:hypothetical protein
VTGELAMGGSFSATGFQDFGNTVIVNGDIIAGLTFQLRNLFIEIGWRSDILFCIIDRIALRQS